MIKIHQGRFQTVVLGRQYVQSSQGKNEEHLSRPATYPFNACHCFNDRFIIHAMKSAQIQFARFDLSAKVQKIATFLSGNPQCSQ